MKGLSPLSLSIPVLSAIEALLLTIWIVPLVMRPTGGGEFTGINIFATLLVAVPVVPSITFLATLVIVLKYRGPEHEAFQRKIAKALLISLLTIPVAAAALWAVQLQVRWALAVNAIALVAFTYRILLHRSLE